MNSIAWTPDVLCLCLAGAALALWQGRKLARKNRDRKHRAFQQKLETVLLPRETVKVICPQRKGQWILTSRRLLLETREGFTALNLKDIQRIQGTNAAGNRTTAVKNMASLTVKAGKEYTIENTGEEFAALYTQLSRKVRKNPRTSSPRKGLS